MKVSISASKVLACLSAALPLALVAQGLQVPSDDTDRSVRAALVSVAHEDGLPGVLSTIQQLEETFNSQYQYHWVFFSTEPLSESFRRQTSNATKAVCLYEVVSPKHHRLESGFESSTHVSAATA